MAPNHLSLLDNIAHGKSYDTRITGFICLFHPEQACIYIAEENYNRNNMQQLKQKITIHIICDFGRGMSADQQHIFQMHWFPVLLFLQIVWG